MLLSGCWFTPLLVEKTENSNPVPPRANARFNTVANHAIPFSLPLSSMANYEAQLADDLCKPYTGEPCPRLTDDLITAQSCRITIYSAGCRPSSFRLFLHPPTVLDSIQTQKKVWEKCENGVRISSVTH